MKRNVTQAVADLALDCSVEHVDRIVDMIEHGVTATPALEIDGTLEIVGRALSVAELKTLLAQRRFRSTLVARGSRCVKILGIRSRSDTAVLQYGEERRRGRPRRFA